MLEKVSSDGYLDIQFSHWLAVYYTLVADWAIFSWMILLITSKKLDFAPILAKLASLRTIVRFAHNKAIKSIMVQIV